MAKNILRKITIDHETYLWKRSHIHLTNYQHSKCIEKVVIYLEGYKKSPLQLLFREEDNLILKSDVVKEKWRVGYPDDGVIWLCKYESPSSDGRLYPINERETVSINLNRPAVIAALIRYFLRKNWKPKESSGPCIIEDALRFLEIIALPKGIT